MTITISGTTGLAGVDGSAASPAIQGSDANTGMFFPAADTISFTTAGTEDVRIDSVGEVTRFNTNPGGVTIKRTDGVNSNGWLNFVGSDDVVDGSVRMATDVANALTFQTAATERARIDSSGRLLINLTTSISSQAVLQVQQNCLTGVMTEFNDTDTTSTNNVIRFRKNGTEAGRIAVTTSNTTQYLTSSDYRLKENVQPMTGALARVALLKPCTYTWKSTGEASQGFIAHELAQVCPDAVSGEKDAVDEDGNIKPQGIDTSFLVATLTAAIQEQQALIAALQADVAALKGAQA
jgi:hypothetical protein